LATRHLEGYSCRPPPPRTGRARVLLDRHGGDGLREHVPGPRGTSPDGDRAPRDRNNPLHGRWTGPRGRRGTLLRHPADALAAASTADTAIVFAPEAREIVTLHDPSAAGWTATPFTMTVALVSSTVPDTATEAWSTVAPSAGFITVTTGAVVSGAGPTSIVRTTCPWLPAGSVATMVTV